MTNTQESEKASLSLKDRHYVQGILERGFFMYDHEEYLDMISEKIEEVCRDTNLSTQTDEEIAEAFRKLYTTLSALTAFNRQYAGVDTSRFETYRGALVCKQIGPKPSIEVIPPLTSEEIEKMRQEEKESD